MYSFILVMIVIVSAILLCIVISQFSTVKFMLNNNKEIYANHRANTVRINFYDLSSQKAKISISTVLIYIFVSLIVCIVLYVVSGEYSVNILFVYIFMFTSSFMYLLVKRNFRVANEYFYRVKGKVVKWDVCGCNYRLQIDRLNDKDLFIKKNRMQQDITLGDKITVDFFYNGKIKEIHRFSSAIEDDDLFDYRNKYLKSFSLALFSSLFFIYMAVSITELLPKNELNIQNLESNLPRIINIDRNEQLNNVKTNDFIRLKGFFYCNAGDRDCNTAFYSDEKIQLGKITNTDNLILLGNAISAYKQFEYYSMDGLLNYKLQKFLLNDYVFVGNDELTRFIDTISLYNKGKPKYKQVEIPNRHSLQLKDGLVDFLYLVARNKNLTQSVSNEIAEFVRSDSYAYESVSAVRWKELVRISEKINNTLYPPLVLDVVRQFNKEIHEMRTNTFIRFDNESKFTLDNRQSIMWGYFFNWDALQKGGVAESVSSAYFALNIEKYHQLELTAMVKRAVQGDSGVALTLKVIPEQSINVIRAGLISLGILLLLLLLSGSLMLFMRSKSNCY